MMKSHAIKEWLSVGEFAQLAGITDESARKIVSAVPLKRSWRGAIIEIRTAYDYYPHTADWAKGMVAAALREVALDSLPTALQTKWHDQKAADQRSQRAYCWTTRAPRT
jgi:hypothetical protein